MKKTNLILFVLTLFVSLTGFVSAHTGDDNFAHHGVMGSGFMVKSLFPLLNLQEL